MSDSDWCKYDGKLELSSPKRVRCPLCRRLLEPSAINSEESIYRLPKHKKPHGKRDRPPKKQSRDTRHRR